MAQPHDKILAIAAKRALHPLGLRRKGQSRLWFGDHSWWLAVVEFQPSGLQKGSYFNIAAHWLWSQGGYVSFDLGRGADWSGRVAEFEAYVSDEQFQSAAERLAKLAAREVRQLAQSIPSVVEAADLLMRRESALSPPSKGSWTAYHAGVAAGLADRLYDAQAMLRSVSDERVKGAVEPFHEGLTRRAALQGCSVLDHSDSANGAPPARGELGAFLVSARLECGRWCRTSAKGGSLTFAGKHSRRTGESFHDG
jgi:hypothetical protein